MAEEPLPGYVEPKPMVFSGFYPVDSDKYEELGKALEKLKLNDASLVFKTESSAMGFGYRCGFLGVLHMEIIQERILREFGVDLIRSAPNTAYRVILNDGRELKLDSPSKFPGINEIENIKEPYLEISIMVPDRYIGNVMELLQNRRGEHRTYCWS